MMAWWYRHTIVQESLAICIFFGPMKYHTTSKKNLKSHFETIVDHQRTRLYDCEGRLWTYSDKSGQLVWVINLPNTYILHQHQSSYILRGPLKFDEISKQNITQQQCDNISIFFQKEGITIRFQFSPSPLYLIVVSGGFFLSNKVVVVSKKLED